MIDSSRRGFLAGAAGLALFSAARATLPAGRDRKLVVVIARGAMDGLSVTPPVGDPNYPALRREITVTAPLKLDGDFGLNPALVNVQKLMLAGEARVAPAVAIPVRGERSHFEGQDLLENGGGRLYAVESGWLNRAIVACGSQTAAGIAVGVDMPLVIRGQAQVGAWNPTDHGAAKDESLQRVTTVLQELYGRDPLLGGALASALEVRGETQMAAGAGAGEAAAGQRNFGASVARLMAVPGGPNVVALSMLGFDTHQRQGANDGLLYSRLRQLDEFIGSLHDGLGAGWRDTVVVVATEFGRTARVNGTGGTDHGTASTALLAGGALKRGGLVGDWPTLAENRLFENRDLAPTLDVRALFKGVLRDHLGIDRTVLDTRVFPNSGNLPVINGLIV